jgi:oligoendopeptidase F
LLPKTADHVRRLKIIENEIVQMDGEAVLLETNGLDRLQQEKLLACFNQDRNETYQEFLERCTAFESEIARKSAAGNLTFAELEENEEDLKKLATWFEKIRKLDFHSASLATDSRERLAHCEALLKAFAQQVFDARDELPPPRARKS